ncbi:uncharacterized protein [Drosophila kikkawai]|uniref:Uncharacterized protein n=1 Tax=Drosophila kikkawai TaxID=30033 RepID=A0A6P4JMX1_DROKI|nr:uncharacterized protein LOC108084391 [Drosophila kikkawai]
MVPFRKISLFVQLILVLHLAKEISAKFEFTNIKCETFSPTFNDFEYCFLKSVNRTYKYASLRARLHQVPITKIKVHFVLYQRLNGYKPFLYNMTVDACKFLKNRKRYPVVKFFYEIVEAYSNINHTCPYSHDVIFDKLPANFVNHRLTDILPVPKGDYMLETNWIAYDINRAVIKFYGTLS